MPKKKQEEQASEAERTAEQVAEELARLEEAEQRIAARSREIEEQLAAGITAEIIEERERSLRRGYPAPPGKKSRELRLELADLQDQLGDVARMRAHLELEWLEFELADADRRYQEANAEVAKIEPKFAAIEQELTQARLVANNVSSGRHSIRQQISRAKNTLYSLDAVYRAEQERQIEERRRQQEEGFRRQVEERAEAFNAAAKEQNPRQIQVS